MVKLFHEFSECDVEGIADIGQVQQVKAAVPEFILAYKPLASAKFFGEIRLKYA